MKHVQYTYIHATYFKEFYTVYHFLEGYTSNEMTIFHNTASSILPYSVRISSPSWLLPSARAVPLNCSDKFN